MDRLRKLSQSILPSLAWIENHVVVNYSPEISKFLDSVERPAIYLSGHLGSFDLMVQAHCLHGHPCDMVVRPFANPHLEHWFKRYREKNGCRVIARHDAFRQVLKSLKNGRAVGMLFDQNVKKTTLSMCRGLASSLQQHAP